MDLKMKDVAELLQVSEKTIYRWISGNKIPAYRINYQYRFNKEEISDWMMRNRIVSKNMPDLRSANQPVSILELLYKGGFHYRIDGNEMKDVIKNSVRLIPTPPEISKEAIISSLIDREEMMTTAFGHGIAVPHPRVPIITNIESESVSFCFLNNPVDFGAMDGDLVRVLFIILSADPKRHLGILSKITYFLQQPDFIHLLHQQKEKEELLKYIQEKEQECYKNAGLYSRKLLAN